MKSVTFKKIVARMGILLLIVTTVSLFAISSAAAEGEATLTGSAPLTEGASPAPEAAGEADEESVTIAGAIADFLRDESAGLLSGFTLLFTILVSLSFRKRVIPSLLDALGTLVGKSREAVGAITEGHEAEHAELVALLSRVEEMLAEARAATTAAEEAAAALTVDGKARIELRTTLAEQSDLLYELLMSANLPQYQKDRIGAQHARVKAALSGDDHD